MMNEKFNNNSGAPCCFASIEPNNEGTGNSHVQILFTIHCPNGNIPDGFVPYLNNCIWTVGCQPKCTSGRGRLEDVRIPASSKNITCRTSIDFRGFCYVLLYMMKDARSHDGLSYPEQRDHHSLTQIGIQPGGLMISFLPQATDGYKTFFGQTRVLVGRATTSNVVQSWHQHHFPPDFPAPIGNFHEPQEPPQEPPQEQAQEQAHDPVQRIVQLAPIDHDGGTSRISVNQWRRRSSRNGGRVGYT